MVITILTSIKIFMKIQENQQAEQELAIQFKILALDIFKILSLPQTDRGIEGLVYLNKVQAKPVAKKLALARRVSNFLFECQSASH